MPEEKHVTLFIASPRKLSNTHLLALEAERALNDRGISTAMVFLADLTIQDCRGCYGCRQPGTGACVLVDDMQDVYRSIRESAGIIVAAPVYFSYVPAAAKAWLDRLVPFIGPDFRPLLPPEKTVSFIFTQNMPDPTLFVPPLRSFMDSVAMTGLSVRDCLIAPDLERGYKPLATERPDLMEAAYRLGENLL